MAFYQLQSGELLSIEPIKACALLEIIGGNVYFDQHGVMFFQFKFRAEFFILSFTINFDFYWPEFEMPNCALKFSFLSEKLHSEKGRSRKIPGKFTAF